MRLELAASYGAANNAQIKSQIALREGLIGQSAADKRVIMLDEVPADFLKITSGLGAADPANVIILPALFEEEVKAVIELASFGEFNDTHQSFLNQLMESVGIVLNTIAATMRTEGLLKQSQLLTAELQARQSELTKKQEELHATNEELQEKAQLLENEKKQVENKNLEIEMARRALEEKAEQLALTSKYKSEFLANMSHELRTPLNSLLILSKLLASNQQGNLNDKQVEFARTINAAGTDLLSLINDILDLSKIESGTVSIDLGDVKIIQLRQHMERTFRQLANDKGLEFSIEIDPRLPETMRTDEKRLQQVVLNLLSNAFKFTARGEVTLRFGLEDIGADRRGRAKVNMLSVAVTDTGIGIPEDKQKLIFEAFQQADGTTSRKYGGTGLGLSISREIANLLGGELRVQSIPGKGSTFTLLVPLDGPQMMSLSSNEAVLADYDTLNHDAAKEAANSDDRNNLGPGDKVILIVEDDPTFGRVLLDVARSSGLKAVLSPAGSGTLALARQIMPDAITLDLGLADIDGWVLFDLLRHDPATASIPIHVISGAQDAAGLSKEGAASVILKPVGQEELAQVFASVEADLHRRRRSVLVVDEDDHRRAAIVAAIRDDSTSVTASDQLPGDAEGAALQSYSSIVLALASGDLETEAWLARFAGDERVLDAVILFAPAASLTVTDELPRLNRLRRAEDIGQLMHILQPPSARSLKQDGGPADLAGTKVLIVDDDIRNIYSLTSFLETRGLEVLHAEGGREGIEILQNNPDIHIALVDIMMPEMDGYETTQKIRREHKNSSLPIIAVTAKAMKGDRQKCLDAGASDYIAKPVDLDLLLALLRVWVGRSRTRLSSSLIASGQ
jgi:signal transduction histidine kinase/CheY-like chemotaxis protein